MITNNSHIWKGKHLQEKPILLASPRRWHILGEWMGSECSQKWPETTGIISQSWTNVSRFFWRFWSKEHHLLFQGQIFVCCQAKLQGSIICRCQPYIQVATLQNILSNYYMIWISSKKHIRPYQIITTTDILTMCCVCDICLSALPKTRHLWQFEVRWRPNLLGDAFMWRATSSWVSVEFHDFRELRFAPLAADRAQGGWRRSVKDFFPVKRILFRPIITEVENDCVWKVATLGVIHV